MRILFILALIWPIQAQSEPNKAEGQWKVDKCIMANFTLDIQIHLNKSQPNDTTIVSVPQSAQVLPISHCGAKDDKDIQVLALGWEHKQENDTANMLHREIQISFRRNETLG